jgi:hypothetical protein
MSPVEKWRRATALVADGLRHRRKSASISQLDMAAKTASTVDDNHPRSRDKMQTRRAAVTRRRLTPP